MTCEATPHHLLLTDEAVRTLDTNMKMNPPLRAEADRQALIEALRSGAIDCIATDHAPHAREEKEQPFELAPMGVTGLETAFAALHTGLVLPGVIELSLAGRADDRGRRAVRAGGADARARRACKPLPRGPGGGVGRGRGGLREPLRQLRVRRQAADRPGADDDRRRLRGLPRAELRAGGGGMSAAYLLLEDGTRFDGESVGRAPVPRRGLGEVVFNTSMSGYQEAVTDPATPARSSSSPTR